MQSVSLGVSSRSQCASSGFIDQHRSAPSHHWGGVHQGCPRFSPCTRPLSSARRGVTSSVGEASTRVVESTYTHAVRDQLFVEHLPAAAPPKHAQLDWFQQWYPIAFVDDIDKSRPHRFVLLGVPLVYWWEPASSAWHVFKDVCPHRLVPLSEGRINSQGQLECGYHGWTFSGSGKCESIPQQGNADTPRACSEVYPVAVRQGLLFVKPTSLPLAVSKRSKAQAATNGSARDVAEEQAFIAALLDESTIPTVPELDEPGWVPQDVWRDLPYDWSTLLENVLDSSHVPFTHHKSMSNRRKIGDYKMKLTDAGIGLQGFNGHWETGPRGGALGPQTTLFQGPTLAKHRIDSKHTSMDSLTIVYATPSSPGRCRLLNRNVARLKRDGQEGFLTRLFRKVPRWAAHVGGQLLLEDDQVFLHVAEPEIARQRAAGKTAGQAYYMASQADTYISAFHTWIDRHAGGGPFGRLSDKDLGPRLTLDQLMDRYSQHTANCSQCQGALRRLRQVRTAATAVGAVAATGALLTTSVALMGTSATATAAAAAASSSGSSTVGANAATAAISGGSPTVGSVLGGVLLAVGMAVAGLPSDPIGCALRAAAWAAVSGLCAALVFALNGMESKFYKGQYPPPRNDPSDD